MKAHTTEGDARSSAAATATALAVTLAGKAPISLARMKGALLSEERFADVLRTEARDLLDIMATADWAEGVAAFAQRRAPHFEGK